MSYIYACHTVTLADTSSLGHTAGEWALMLNGSARIQAINSDGQTFIDDVSKGDVWVRDMSTASFQPQANKCAQFFPSGVPHSIQGLENGTEFILIFDDGAFSEDSTFGVSETFSRNPVSSFHAFKS